MSQVMIAGPVQSYHQLLSTFTPHQSTPNFQINFVLTNNRLRVPGDEVSMNANFGTQFNTSDVAVDHV